MLRQDFARVEGELEVNLKIVVVDRGWLLLVLNSIQSLDHHTPHRFLYSNAFKAIQGRQLTSERRFLRTPNTQMAVRRLQPSTTAPLLAVGFLYIPRCLYFI